MPAYQHLTDDELLHLNEDRDQLTGDARVALDAELNQRRISPSDINSFRLEHEKAEKNAQLKRATRAHLSGSGVGRRFMGKANLQRDPGGQFEQYDSTLWFVVLWFPVFPIGTFTVRRFLGPQVGVAWPGREIAIERHRRNWEQILLTWIKATLLLFALIVIVPRILVLLR